MTDNLTPNEPQRPEEPGAPSAPAYRAEEPVLPGAPNYPASAGNTAATPVPGKTLGIVGLILSFFVSLVGLIMSIVAVVQSKKAGAKNVPGIIGIVIGSLGTLAGILVAIFFIWATMQSLTWLETCSADPYAAINVFGVPFSCSELGLDEVSLSEY